MKDLSSTKSTKKNDETSSMIVNVGKKVKTVKKSDKSLDKPNSPDAEEPEKKSM